MDKETASAQSETSKDELSEDQLDEVSGGRAGAHADVHALNMTKKANVGTRA